MGYETVLLPEFSPDGTIISAKEQFHNSYAFGAMPILIFSPVQIIITHPRLFSPNCRQFITFDHKINSILVY